MGTVLSRAENGAALQDARAQLLQLRGELARGQRAHAQQVKGLWFRTHTSLGIWRGFINAHDARSEQLGCDQSLDL